MPKDTEEVIQELNKHKIEFTQLQFTDIQGTIKSVTAPRKKLEEALEVGIWFDGSSIEGFTRIAESDMILRPDCSTFQVLPETAGETVTARMICDVHTPENQPFEGDPRQVLKKAVEKADKLGYIFNVGPELEFFLFKQKEGKEIISATHDKAGYFDFAPKDQAMQVRKDIIRGLQNMGLEIEMAHHEVAPGQHEIDYKYGEALKTADRAITFKHIVKSVATKHGLHATFMPKPLFGESGSGMHVHQSLFDKEGTNLFFDKDGNYKLSELAQQFIAGQLKHARAMSAVVAPTVNSYKRLTPGFEAPIYICWGQTNRSALIRIPRYSIGREQSTRAELRCPDPSCNPYLAFAVMLEAGLNGIEKKLLPPEPIEGNVYELDNDQLKENGIKKLPRSLGEAIKALEQDKVIKGALGSHITKKFIRAKKAEYEKYRLQVTPWEIETYF